MPPAGGKQRPGKQAAVEVGDGAGNIITLNVRDSDVTERGDDLDTTNMESGGYETGIIGIQVAEFNCQSDWDAGRNFYDSPPGIYPRSDLPTLQIIENTADGNGWSFALARVLSSKNTLPTRGKVGFDFSGKSNGTYTRPTGSH